MPSPTEKNKRHPNGCQKTPITTNKSTFSNPEGNSPSEKKSTEVVLMPIIVNGNPKKNKKSPIKNVLFVKTSASWSKLGCFLSNSRLFSAICKMTYFTNKAKVNVPAI